MFPLVEQFGDRGLTTPKGKCAMGDNNNRTAWVEEALTTVHMGSASKVGALRVGPLSRFPVFLLPLLELAGPSAFLLSFWACKGALHIVTRDPVWRAPSPHTAHVLSEFSGLKAQSPSLCTGPPCALERFAWPFVSFAQTQSIFYGV